MPGVIGEEPEGSATANFQDMSLNKCPKFLSEGGVPGAMSHKGLDVLDELSGMEVWHT